MALFSEPPEPTFPLVSVDRWQSPFPLLTKKVRLVCWFSLAWIHPHAEDDCTFLKADVWIKFQLLPYCAQRYRRTNYKGLQVALVLNCSLVPQTVLGFRQHHLAPSGGLWRAHTAHRAVQLCAQRVAAPQCSVSKIVNLDPWDCFVLQPMTPLTPERQWALVISLIMGWIWANLTSFSTWMEEMDSSLLEYRGRLTPILSSYSISTFQKSDVVRTKSHLTGN